MANWEATVLLSSVGLSSQSRLPFPSSAAPKPPSPPGALPPRGINVVSARPGLLPAQPAEVGQIPSSNMPPQTLVCAVMSRLLWSELDGIANPHSCQAKSLTSLELEQHCNSYLMFS